MLPSNTSHSQTTGGIVGFFADDHAALKAAHSTFKAGYRKFDSLSPFPIHGMDEAMGLKRSFLPWVTLIGGLTGLAIALGFQTWVNVYDWPIIIGGKPLWGLPAFIPITFELTVLIGRLSTVGAMIAVCRLPKVNPPIIDLDLTCHKFAIFIPENDFGYDNSKTTSFLQSLGATEVRRVEKF